MIGESQPLAERTYRFGTRDCSSQPLARWDQLVRPQIVGSIPRQLWWLLVRESHMIGTLGDRVCSGHEKHSDVPGSRVWNLIRCIVLPSFTLAVLVRSPRAERDVGWWGKIHQSIASKPVIHEISNFRTAIRLYLSRRGMWQRRVATAYLIWG